MKKVIKNLPNIITSSRIASSLIASSLFITGHLTPAVILYIYGALSDVLDGVLARKLNAMSELGRKLDAISDKVFALSLLLPSLALGNLAMAIPLVLELEITSITGAARKSNVSIETERVGKYKTWFLFISVILGLLSTLYPIMHIPLYASLIYTTKFQLQSIKAYNNQYEEKLLNKNIINNNKEISQIINNKEKLSLKEQLKHNYHELMFYNNIEINTNTKPKVRKKEKIKRRNNKY